MPDLIEPSKALAQVIWTRRQVELGLSRELLAERLGWVRNGDGGDAAERSGRSGFSPRTIVRLEKGERGLRSEREFEFLCRALEIDRDAFRARLSLVRQSASSGSEVGEGAEGDVRLILGRISNDLATLTRLLTPPPDQATGPSGLPDTEPTGD